MGKTGAHRHKTSFILEKESVNKQLTLAERADLEKMSNKLGQEIDNLKNVIDQNHTQRLFALRQGDFELGNKLFEANAKIGQQIIPLKRKKDCIEQKLFITK